MDVDRAAVVSNLKSMVVATKEFRRHDHKMCVVSNL
jgi:hypothetical protein